MDYSAILFHSNNYSLWTARALKKEGIERKLIPLPRHLSSDCGYCVRIMTIDVVRVEKLLSELGIEYDRIAEI
jgi:hypothetical protein